MATCKEELNTLPGFDLAPLTAVDPKAFISGDEGEQKVCDFILSLALIYNDFKDIVWAMRYLHICKPKNPNEVTPYRGQYAAFDNHLTRLYCGLINELFELVKDGSQVLAHPLFSKTVNLLSKDAKQHWQALVQMSRNEKPGDNTFKETFARVRNKITYHSDIKEISSGYRHFFFDQNGNTKMDALMSRGNGLPSTRFYFADALVEGYLNKRIGGKRADFIKTLGELTDHMRTALNEIITKFINVRGFGFRPYSS